jgi:hypothetical protein
VRDNLEERQIVVLVIPSTDYLCMPETATEIERNTVRYFRVFFWCAALHHVFFSHPEPLPATTQRPEPGLTMSITHRLNTGGSVQALTILDDDCLIAGLQGGKILVSPRTSLLSHTPRRGILGKRN